ncbi:MAG TPA: amidohydrolase family protein [Acidimicrobiales bacterium]|nr:amidohydrolase family protein [Acidimicrobiales bacterium]
MPTPGTAVGGPTPDGDAGPDRRYTIISADAHAGGDIQDYRPYLASAWHDEFDAWAAGYVNPFADLLAPTAYRSWDSERRLAENEADGIAAEVLFPNSVPPFFEEGSLVALPPTPATYERRWAGLQAHNRWLADFCAAVPGRRAGVAQVFVNRVEEALAEIRWAATAFSPFAGILLPSVPPGAELAPWWDPVYEPLWDLCEELEVVVNIHGGGGIPDYGDHEVARAVMLVELPWFSHRPVWHLIFGGIVERHPSLRVVLTEQGLAWIPRGLETLDWFHGRMTHGGAAEANFFGAAAKGMTLTPSEYFARNFHVGASFLRSSESALRHQVGVERIMWGADYPHSEGSFPYSTLALRAAFGGCDPAEVTKMVETNAAALYGFDLEALRTVGARIGPRVTEVARPLDVEDYPTDSTCNAFDRHQVLRSW